MERMKKTAKFLDVFAQLGLVVSVIAMVLFGLAAAVMLKNGLTGSDMELLTSLSFGGAEFSVAPAYRPAPGSGMLYAAAAMVLGLVFSGLLLWAIRLIRQILRPMMDGAPFSGLIGTCLGRLAWLSVAAGLVSNGLEYVLHLYQTRFYDLEALFLSEKIIAVELEAFGPDLSFLVTAAVFYLMGCIFRYGTQLQTLSDETL